MERHAAGEIVDVPIILENCDWPQSPLGKIQALPPRAKPVAKICPPSDAWHSIAVGLREVLKGLRATHKEPAARDRYRR